MSKFVQYQLRTGVTSRGMLDRILRIHEMMARELFDEMDDDDSGVTSLDHMLAFFASAAAFAA